MKIRKPSLRITKRGLRVQPPSVRIGDKVGVNISKSGVSASVRTKHVTANTRRGCTVHAIAFIGVAAASLILFVGAVT